MASFFKRKGNSASGTIKVDTATPVQNTAPTDNSKLWVDTSAQ
jgi:hypothetical protein